MSESRDIADVLVDLKRVLDLLNEPGPGEPGYQEPGWVAAVIDRGEAPHGTCGYCGVARSPAGCLNLCEQPAGFVRKFNDGLYAVLHEQRDKVRMLEALAGCTCPPPYLRGYEVERDHHELGCPAATPPESARL